MNALIIVGATGKIADTIIKRCLDNNVFGKYILIGRNIERLSEYKNSNTEKVYLIEQELGEGSEINIPDNLLDGVDDIRVLMLAFSIKPIAKIGEINQRDVVENININIVSQVLFINYLCLIKEKTGCELEIICIDSGAAYTPIKGWSMYCSSKAYMSMFLECLCRDTDVKAVLFEPGVIDTPMQEYIRSIDEDVFDQVEQFRKYKEDGVLRQPEVVANELYERYIIQWSALDLKEHYQK